MYPHLSERAAKVFANNASVLHRFTNKVFDDTPFPKEWASACCSASVSDSSPRNRRLADRYKKASDYLYSRIGRTEDGMLTEPGYELVNDNEPR